MAHPDTRNAFNPAALLTALEAKKRADGISWREVARRAGIPRSYGFAGKLRAGAHPTAGVLALLLAYLGETDLAPYLGENRPGTTAPAASAAGFPPERTPPRTYPPIVGATTAVTG